jgi:hypothetical protein
MEGQHEAAGRAKKSGKVGEFEISGELDFGHKRVKFGESFRSRKHECDRVHPYEL